jgi:hypothetical protein
MPEHGSVHWLLLDRGRLKVFTRLPMLGDVRGRGFVHQKEGQLIPLKTSCLEFRLNMGTWGTNINPCETGGSG